MTLSKLVILSTLQKGMTSPITRREWEYFKKPSEMLFNNLVQRFKFLSE